MTRKVLNRSLKPFLQLREELAISLIRTVHLRQSPQEDGYHEVLSLSWLRPLGTEMRKVLIGQNAFGVATKGEIFIKCDL